MLLSMTGHGEAHGQSDRLHLTAEVRSVNNRYFKLMLRAPEPYNLLETEVEKLARRLGCEKALGHSAGQVFLQMLEWHTSQTRHLFNELFKRERAV